MQILSIQAASNYRDCWQTIDRRIVVVGSQKAHNSPSFETSRMRNYLNTGVNLSLWEPNVRNLESEQFGQEATQRPNICFLWNNNMTRTTSVFEREFSCSWLIYIIQMWSYCRCFSIAWDFFWLLISVQPENLLCITTPRRWVSECIWGNLQDHKNGGHTWPAGPQGLTIEVSQHKHPQVEPRGEPSSMYEQMMNSKGQHYQSHTISQEVHHQGPL